MATILPYNVIRVTATDGPILEPPNTTQPVEPDSSVNFYRLCEANHPKSVLWLKKGGHALALYLNRTQGADLDPDAAKLEDFPQGYKLYQHRTRKDQHGKERTDMYLFGRHRFRSPNEFEPHLIYLVSDRQIPCTCKYCGSANRVKPTPPVRLSTLAIKTTKKDRARNDGQHTFKNGNGDTHSISPGERSRTAESSTRDKRSAAGAPYTRPSMKRYFAYRRGELVWADLKMIDEFQMGDWNDEAARYWPALVNLRERTYDRTAGTSSGAFELMYNIRLIAMKSTKRARESALRPWNSSMPNASLLNFADAKDADGDALIAQDTIGEAYCLAVRRVEPYVATYASEGPYAYQESADRLDSIPHEERERMIAMQKYPHYNFLWVGAEHLYEGDMLRLKPESGRDAATTDLDANVQFLRVSTIYEHPDNGIQLTGDIYRRGRPLRANPEAIDDFDWMPENAPDEEYTVDLADIAGRFYPTWPNISGCANVSVAKTVDERWDILSSDNVLDSSEDRMSLDQEARDAPPHIKSEP